MGDEMSLEWLHPDAKHLPEKGFRARVMWWEQSWREGVITHISKRLINVELDSGSGEIQIEKHHWKKSFQILWDSELSERREEEKRQRLSAMKVPGYQYNKETT
jgi:hypothetical protein